MTFAIGIPTLTFSLGVFHPFGGTVSIVWPCVTTAFDGSYAVEVFEMTGVTTYVWGPSTATFLMGPPKNPGQSVLGLAIPFKNGCPTSIVKGNPTDFMGEYRMIMVGTSAI